MAGQKVFATYEPGCCVFRNLAASSLESTRLVWQAIDDSITPVRKGDRETIVCRKKIDDRFNFSGKLITKINKPTAIERPG